MSKMKDMTKKDFMARIENAWDMGYISPEILNHIQKAYDALHRLQGDQFRYFFDFLEAEAERMQHFSNHMQLANDKLGYQGVYLLAILNHHCQICATDKDAWHTRGGFCPHKK